MAQPFMLDPGETVILDVRRHWISILPVVVSAAVAAAAAAVVAYLIGLQPFSLGNYLPGWLGWLIVLLLLAMGVIVLGGGFWVYRRNRLILTNRHLIKVAQAGLFNRKVSQLALARVQDVNGSRRGILATLLNFGQVEVQTAGEEEEFVFTMMPNPSQLADELMKAHDNLAPASQADL